MTTLHGYRDGERVCHRGIGATGTVHIWQLNPADARDCGYAIAGEIRWDGCFVADELELALPHIHRI